MAEEQKDNIEQELPDVNPADEMSESKINMDNPITDYKQLSEENLNGWRRAMADYQNLKKENEVKYKDGRVSGQDDVIEKILPIVGYFKHAIDSVPADLEQSGKTSQWVAGIKHINQYFLDALKTFGLERIETENMKFNPIEHEALGEEDSQLESGMIIKEVSPGFKRDEKVIIPAKVIVSK